MIMKLITPPIIEPVTLDEVKKHCIIDIDEDDLYLDSLLKTAREYIEQLCGPLISQVWEQYEQNFPCGDHLRIGKPRIISFTSLTYTDVNNVTETLSSTYYIVDTINEYWPAVVLNYGYYWPNATLIISNPIKLTFTCGYGTGATNVPAPIRQAMLILISHWYEQRQPVNMSISGNSVVPIPFTVDALLANYRTW